MAKIECDCKAEITHIRELLSAHEKLDELRHSSEGGALRLATNDMNRRLDEMNKFREQINSERAEYLQRNAYEREHGVLSDRVKDLEIARGENKGEDTGKSAVYAGLMGVGLIIVEIILRFWPTTAAAVAPAIRR